MNEIAGTLFLFVSMAGFGQKFAVVNSTLPPATAGMQPNSAVAADGGFLSWVEPRGEGLGGYAVRKGLAWWEALAERSSRSNAHSFFCSNGGSFGQNLFGAQLGGP